MYKEKLITAKTCIFLVFYFIGMNQIVEAQGVSICKVIETKTDTIECDTKKMIIQLDYCEQNGLYQEGIVTDINEVAEFCFFYKYNNRNELEKITFWTFEWSGSGYRTKEKIANLYFVKNKSKLVIKGKYDLNYEFVKRITKT